MAGGCKGAVVPAARPRRPLINPQKLAAGGMGVAGIRAGLLNIAGRGAMRACAVGSTGLPEPRGGLSSGLLRTPIAHMAHAAACCDGHMGRGDLAEHNNERRRPH